MHIEHAKMTLDMICKQVAIIVVIRVYSTNGRLLMRVTFFKSDTVVQFHPHMHALQIAYGVPGYQSMPLTDLLPFLDESIFGYSV
jgi:hypothetical protein